MIFGQKIILKIVEDKIIEITNLNPNNIRPFSIDISLENIYELNNKEGILKKLDCKNGIILENNKVYYFEPFEKIKIDNQKYFFNVFGKSKAARIGLNIIDNPIDKNILTKRDEDDSKQIIIEQNIIETPVNKEEFYSYLFRIENYGTKIKLRKGDIIAQIIFSNNTGDLFGAYNKEKTYITLDENILIYDGKTILELNKDNTKAFRLLKLTDKGDVTILRNTFFIGLSQEYFEIPTNKIGFLINFSQGDPNFRQNFKFSSHPSCPLIGHKGIFEGKITLEFYTITDCIIKKGELISTINYINVKGTINKKSNYNKQSLQL